MEINKTDMVTAPWSWWEVGEGGTRGRCNYTNTGLAIILETEEERKDVVLYLKDLTWSGGKGMFP